MQFLLAFLPCNPSLHCNSSFTPSREGFRGNCSSRPANSLWLQESFLSRVLGVREEELRGLWRSFVISALNTSIIGAVPVRRRAQPGSEASAFHKAWGKWCLRLRICRGQRQAGWRWVGKAQVFRDKATAQAAGSRAPCPAAHSWLANTGLWQAGSISFKPAACRALVVQVLSALGSFGAYSLLSSEPLTAAQGRPCLHQDQCL